MTVRVTVTTADGRQVELVADGIEVTTDMGDTLDVFGSEPATFRQGEWIAVEVQP